MDIYEYDMKACCVSPAASSRASYLRWRSQSPLAIPRQHPCRPSGNFTATARVKRASLKEPNGVERGGGLHRRRIEKGRHEVIGRRMKNCRILHWNGASMRTYFLQPSEGELRLSPPKNIPAIALHLVCCRRMRAFVAPNSREFRTFSEVYPCGGALDQSVR